MKRTVPIALAGSLLLTGCLDLGLEDNRPLGEAETVPPFELVAAVHGQAPQATARLILDGRMWVPAGAPRTLRQDEVRSIGSAHGQGVFARSWDRPPYDEVFVRLPADSAGAAGSTARPLALEAREWQAYQPVIGDAGAPAPPGEHEPAGDAGHADGGDSDAAPAAGGH